MIFGVNFIWIIKTDFHLDIWSDIWTILWISPGLDYLDWFSSGYVHLDWTSGLTSGHGHPNLWTIWTDIQIQILQYILWFGLVIRTVIWTWMDIISDDSYRHLEWHLDNLDYQDWLSSGHLVWHLDNLEFPLDYPIWNFLWTIQFGIFHQDWISRLIYTSGLDIWIDIWTWTEIQFSLDLGLNGHHSRWLVWSNIWNVEYEYNNDTKQKVEQNTWTLPEIMNVVIEVFGKVLNYQEKWWEEESKSSRLHYC